MIIIFRFRSVLVNRQLVFVVPTTEAQLEASHKHRESARGGGYVREVVSWGSQQKEYFRQDYLVVRKTYMLRLLVSFFLFVTSPGNKCIMQVVKHFYS